MSDVRPTRVIKMRSPGGEYEVIELPNKLMAKTGKPVFDHGLVVRAEASIKHMQLEYEDIAQDALRKLSTAAAALRTDLDPAVALGQLFSAAHELAGLGGTFGYPFVTQIAASLRTTVQVERPCGQLVATVDAHVAALHNVITNKIRGNQNKLVGTVARELETLATKLGQIEGPSSPSPCEK